MRGIKELFWNSNQRRPRALWRLIGQLVILGAVVLVVGGALGCLATAILSVRATISPDQLSDPLAVQRSVMQDPLLVMVGSLGSGVVLTVSIWLGGRFLDRRPFAGFGLHLDHDWWVDFGFGLALGAVLMLLVFLVELSAGWLTVTGAFVTRQSEAAFIPAILPPLVTFLAVGVYEELFFRGYQLQNMAEGLTGGAISPQAAILIATMLSSLVFGVAHALNPNASPRSTANIVIAGILLGTGFLLTGELAIPIALHITWNFFQGNVFGFPVSGNDFSSATLIGIEQGGPNLWTGGSFGPEAGLVGVGAMLVGVALTLLWVRWRYNRVGLALSLTEPPQTANRTG